MGLSHHLKKEKEQGTVSDAIAQCLYDALAKLGSRMDDMEKALPGPMVDPGLGGADLTLVDSLQRNQPDYSDNIVYLRDQLQKGQPDHSGDVPVLQDLVNKQFQALADGLNGKAILKLDSAAENVLASELNAADAGDFTREFDVSLDSSEGSHQWWAAFTPTLTTGKSANPATASAPTLDYPGDIGQTPIFLGGNLRLLVIFDTDAGATKVYAAGDSVTVTIQVAADDKLVALGLSTYTVAQIVKTYDVV